MSRRIPTLLTDRRFLVCRATDAAQFVRGRVAGAPHVANALEESASLNCQSAVVHFSPQADGRQVEDANANVVGRVDRRNVPMDADERRKAAEQIARLKRQLDDRAVDDAAQL